MGVLARGSSSAPPAQSAGGILQHLQGEEQIIQHQDGSEKVSLIHNNRVYDRSLPIMPSGITLATLVSTHGDTAFMRLTR